MMFQHACRCGAVEIQVNVPAPSAGTRMRCYCGDCQTAARLNDPEQDTLDAVGASDIWHTTPDRIDFLAGRENLKIYRLSPRGGYRWCATCCGTLMFSTLQNLKLPFVSIALRQPETGEADKVLGAVKCHAFTESARPGPGAPAKSSGMYRAGARIAMRAIRAWISGRARKSPLHPGNGVPIAEVEVITLDTRKAARPDHLR